MKTKYILHGGNAQHVNSENDKFFAEILRDTKNKVQILLVEFAGRDEKTDLNYQMETGFKDIYPEIESLFLPEYKFKVFEINQ